MTTTTLAVYVILLLIFVTFITQLTSKVLEHYESNRPRWKKVYNHIQRNKDKGNDSYLLINLRYELMTKFALNPKESSDCIAHINEEESWFKQNII